MTKPTKPRVTFVDNDAKVIHVAYTDKNGERVKAGYLANTWEIAPKKIAEQVLADCQRPPICVYHTRPRRGQSQE
jgi:hypothetical protein